MKGTHGQRIPAHIQKFRTALMAELSPPEVQPSMQTVNSLDESETLYLVVQALLLGAGTFLPEDEYELQGH